MKTKAEGHDLLDRLCEMAHAASKGQYNHFYNKYRSLLWEGGEPVEANLSVVQYHLFDNNQTPGHCWRIAGELVGERWWERPPEKFTRQIELTIISLLRRRAWSEWHYMPRVRDALCILSPLEETETTRAYTIPDAGIAPFLAALIDRVEVCPVCDTIEYLIERFSMFL